MDNFVSPYLFDSVLFNTEDTVYHPAERMLDEYVMNPSGLIFQGTNKQKTVKPWIYGQVLYKNIIL